MEPSEGRCLKQSAGVRPVQTTFSCAHDLSLFSKRNRPCRLCGRNADPNGDGRQDQTFPHSLRSGSPTWSSADLELMRATTREARVVVYVYWCRDLFICAKDLL